MSWNQTSQQWEEDFKVSENLLVTNQGGQIHQQGPQQCLTENAGSSVNMMEQPTSSTAVSSTTTALFSLFNFSPRLGWGPFIQGHPSSSIHPFHKNIILSS
jgi:hypothetical protein